MKISDLNISTLSRDRGFANIAGRSGSVWLDSSLTVGEKGVSSLTATDPCAELRMNGGSLTYRAENRTLQLTDDVDLIAFIERTVTANNWTAVGFISYEAMLPYLGLSATSPDSPIDDAAFYFYEAAGRDATSDSMDHSNPPPRPEPGRLLQSVPYERYCRNVRTILDHIREGDIYQANLTCRFEIENDSDPFSIYQKLRELNPAPYSAFLNFGDYQVLSSSPEQMLLRRDGRIVSSPIKGTAPLGADESKTNDNIRALLSSAKDKAELLMIVDLVRNDLGRIAQSGSVRVEELFSHEQYSSLIHLVARVSAIPDTGVALQDICRSLMPGGSITGAPKKRAVEIINNLETVPRSVYTGCIGYIAPDSCEFNIAIRTMYTRDSIWYVHAGGGIVADSTPESEYEEMLLKARNLIEALGVRL